MFEFTEEDLKLNKRGQLSPRQEEWLGMTVRGIRSCSWTSALVAVFFHFLGLSIILALYLQNERSRAALFSNPMNLIVFAATALVVLAILAFSILLARRQANRLVGAQLQSAEGKAHLDETSDGKFTSYLVFIGKKKLTFADDMNAIFKDGKKYKVYFCKSGVYEFVMSYEWIE